MIIKSHQKFLILTQKNQFYKRRTFLSLCERTDKLTCLKFLIFAWKPISYTCAKKLKSFIFDNFYISKTSLSLYWRSIIFFIFIFIYIFFSILNWYLFFILREIFISFIPILSFFFLLLQKDFYIFHKAFCSLSLLFW